MEPLAAEQIHGNWATTLLPLDDREQIDWSRLRDQLDAIIAAGVDGLYCHGTSGEFEALSEDEFDRVSAMIAERCEAAGTPFQIGANHTSPPVAIERVRRAAALRPGAIQVILADWYPLSDAECVDCLTRYAEAAAPIGLVLYNPPHAKRVLSPEAFGRLHRVVPALVGLKVADGDDAWYRQMRAHAGGLSLFVPGHNLATGLRQGASGAYSNVACLQPARAQRWYELMHRDYGRALRIQGAIQAFMQDHVVPLRDRDGYGNMALDKLLAAIGGWTDLDTRLRWPYRGVPREHVQRLRPIAHRELAEFFEL